MFMTQIVRPRKWLILLITMTSFMSFAQNTNVNSSANTPEEMLAAMIAKENKPVTPDEIIASVGATNKYYSFDEGLAGRIMYQREHLITVLLNIFRDGRASNDQKCAAAFYLGEMRASEAVDDLANNIALHMSPGPTYGGMIGPSIPVALVKIGTPAVPALIKNLQESDDGYVRKSSLTVLYAIEGDKDVVQLRLQKALDAQSDTTKKVRLQAAIKSLPEIKMQPGVFN
jgi:HEAT repeat protein